MKKEWLTIAAELLEMAADEFTNHGCNDFPWPDGWTEEQKRELATKVACLNYRNERTPEQLSAEDREDIEQWTKGKYAPHDWVLMRTLAKIFLAESGQGEG